MKFSKRIAFDTECTGLDFWHGARPFAVSMCDDEGHKQWFEWRVDPVTRIVSPRKDDVRLLRVYLESPDIEKIFFNLKFDMRMLSGIGITVRPPYHDTMFMVHACKSDFVQFYHRVGLKMVCRRLLDYPIDDEEALHKACVAARRVARREGWITGSEVEHDYWLPGEVYRHFPKESPPEWKTVCKTYGIGDAERTILLYLMCLKWFKSFPKGVWNTYQREMRLHPHVYDIEQTGVRVDMDEIQRQTKETRKYLELNLKWFEKKHGKLNPNSHKQCCKLLFDKLKLKPVAWNIRKHEDGSIKSKSPKLDADALEIMSQQCPEADRIKGHRDALRLISNYYARFQELAVKEGDEWIVHPNIRQVGARTGRVSITDPALQTLPRPPKTKEEAAALTPSRKMLLSARKPLGPRKGKVWILIDWNQIEARLFAEHSGESALLKSFANGTDVYQDLANRITKLRGYEIPRQHAKSVFLGKIYGEGPGLLSVILGIAYEKAMELVNDFNRAYPDAAKFMRKVQYFVEQHKCIVNRFGRVVPVDPRFAYKGVNYLIQGEAADLMKELIIKLGNWLIKKTKGAVKIVLQVHDELILELDAMRCTQTFIRKVRDMMADNGGVYKKVKTPAEASVARRSWFEKEKVEL